MNKFYLYILRCRDGSFYIGHTDNIDKRVCEHQEGRISCYTKKRRPFAVVYVQEFDSRYEALVAERQIKKWSRAKKQAFINANFG